jgi:hypothetical protein
VRGSRDKSRGLSIGKRCPEAMAQADRDDVICSKRFSNVDGTLLQFVQRHRGEGHYP